MSMPFITTWIFSPNEPFELARRFADLEGTAFFYSGGSLDSAQASFLCLFPERKICFQATKNSWDELKQSLGSYDPEASSMPRWVGYLGYEMGCVADPDKQISGFLGHSSNQPDCCFYAPSVVIHFDHFHRRATLYQKELCPNNLKSVYPHNQKSWNFEGTKVLHCSDTVQSYIEKIKRAKEWILDGDIYQVNLSQTISIQMQCSAFDLFEKVACLNPAPFSAYINCGNFSIVSSSPERFLCKRQGMLETRPIKGTAARGKTQEEDLRNRKTLLSSSKERAELLMITDLMRSDLGRVAIAGSVKTKEIWRCETYENVFHLLSIIQANVDVDLHPLDCIRPLFPAGSITGCPKLTAMEAIANLEMRSRGIYSGSIGYFAENGNFDFNVAIRTLIVHPESIQLQLGGAIVIDSDAMKEYEETLHKGRSFFSILKIKELLDLLHN